MNLPEVRIPSLYSHAASGEGIHYMPEVGSWCWVCKPSDSAETAFVLLGGSSIVKDNAPSGKTGSFDMNRPIMNPGDIALLTRDGNGLALRRGGVVELRGTALSKIIFDPPKNRILTIAENYTVQTFGGTMTWRNLRRENDPNGLMGTRYQIKAKEYADNSGHSVQITLGNTGEVPVALQAFDESDALGTPVEETRDYVLASSAQRAKGTNVATSSPGKRIPITTKTVSSVNPSARVVDLRIYKDETKSEDELDESLVLGMDREGDVEMDTEGAVRLQSDNWFEFVVGGNVPAIKDKTLGVKKVCVTTEELGSTEPVVKGESFLTDLSKSLLEIQAALTALGVPTTQTANLIANITTSLVNGSPYLSKTLESE
jgi:hypothetical protein